MSSSQIKCHKLRGGDTVMLFIHVIFPHSSSSRTPVTEATGTSGQITGHHSGGDGRQGVLQVNGDVRASQGVGGTRQGRVR